MADDQCILHKGATAEGYGIKKRFGRNLRAHRLAYCDHHHIKLEEIDGMVVMHTCDNRLCINPSHLRLGTHADNCHDKVSKGRQARGENSGNAKLLDAEVLEIKRLFKRGATNPFIADCYNVSVMCISRIRSGKTWRHIWEE